MIEHHRPPYEWAPGWRGRWNALPWILREETVSVFRDVRRKDGWLPAVVKFPVVMPLDLRCSFALIEQPVMAYYAMRRHLANTHPELTLDDADARQQWCLDIRRRFR